MLYHFDKNQRDYYKQQSVDQIYNHFVDSSSSSSSKKKKTYRVPMTNIVDFTSWGGDGDDDASVVPVVDYETWRNDNKNNNNTNRSSMMIELSRRPGDEKNHTGGGGAAPFNCANTKFTMNSSLHGIVETSISCQDHIGLKKRNPIKTYTYRDIATTLQPFQPYQVWQFSFLYPNALFDLPSIPPSLFQLHYTPVIRKAVQTILLLLQTSNQSWSHHQRYASIHIRGGDGGYAKQDWATLFPNLLNETSRHILEYHYNKKKKDPTSSSSSSSNTTSTTYVLLVVSDIKGLQKRDKKDKIFQLWKKSEQIWQEELWKNHQIHMDITSASNYSKQINDLKNMTQSNEAGVYLDQLLAACADISFVASSEVSSTYQQRIRAMRNQTISPCP